MNTVTLIHSFAVKPEDEEKFMNLWKKVDGYMRLQDGFIETKLHKSLDEQTHLPQAKFRFVNVARWRSVESFEKAVICEKFKECARDIFPYSGGAGLYEVIID